MAEEYVRLKSQDELDKLIEYREALREGIVEGSIEKFVKDHHYEIVEKLKKIGVVVEPITSLDKENLSFIVDKTHMALKLGYSESGSLTVSVGKEFYDAAMQYVENNPKE